MTSRVSRGIRASKDDGITFYPVERLGNQLFTYAAGLAQARRLGCPYYANLGFYRRRRPVRAHGKSYDLGAFDNGVTVPEGDAYHRPPFLALPSVPAAQLWHRTVAPHVPGLTPPVFMESSFSYDERIQRIRPGTTILGHFQSWRYFDEIGDEIRTRMSHLVAPSDWFREVSRQVHPGRGSIVLHVRRGDYVLPEQQRVQGLATKDYYVRALDVLRRLGFDGTVFLASDSLDLAMKELDGVEDVVPIDPPPGTRDFEVLLMLSRADALVAGNSSFSWWAGYIGSRPGHVVIAPRPWMTTADLDTRDLLPKDWLTLDRT
jgi:hypothetical protein